MPNSSGLSEHHIKLMYWLLGSLVSIVLALSGLGITQQLAQSDKIDNRLTQLEIQAADSNRGLNDTEKRLQRIENKIDKIQDWVK